MCLRRGCPRGRQPGRAGCARSLGALSEGVGHAGSPLYHILASGNRCKTIGLGYFEKHARGMETTWLAIVRLNTYMACVCMYVQVHVHVYLAICMHIIKGKCTRCTRMCVHTYACMHVWVYAYIYMYLDTDVCTCMDVHIRIYVCVYIAACMCIIVMCTCTRYMCICVFMYMYMHIYICICM